MVDKNVNEFRIKEMINQKMSLEKDLHRYKKLLKRWEKADAIITVGGVVSLGLNEILIIINTFCRCCAHISTDIRCCWNCRSNIILW